MSKKNNLVSHTSSSEDFDFAWCHGFGTLSTEVYQYRYCGYRAKINGIWRKYKNIPM